MQKHQRVREWERERERERERECKLLYFDNITMTLCHRFAMLLQCWATGLSCHFVSVTVHYCSVQWKCYRGPLPLLCYATPLLRPSDLLSYCKLPVTLPRLRPVLGPKIVPSKQQQNLWMTVLWCCYRGPLLLVYHAHPVLGPSVVLSELL